MAAKVFADFTKFVTEQYPSYNVDPLLPTLSIFDVITPNEVHVIRNTAMPTQKVEILFKETMANKDLPKQRTLVIVLRNNGQDTIARFLEDALNSLEEPPKSAAAAEEIDKKPKVKHQNYLLGILKSHSYSSYEQELEYLRSFHFNIPDCPGNFTVSVEPATTAPPDMTVGGDDYYINYSHKRSLVGGVLTDRPPKGRALLISNIKFNVEITSKGQVHHEPRRGGEVDESNMRKLLEMLEYDVVVKTNRTANQMQKDVKKFAESISQEDPERFHSIVVVVMTHGDPGLFYGVDWNILEENSFFDSIVKNKSLAGKPKFFFIQACRGTMIHKTVDGTTASKLPPFVSKLPEGIDICVLHSTTPGYFSWRNTHSGSWFIQTVFKEFAENAHKPSADFMTLATRVTRQVATTFCSAEGYVQAPQMVTNLTKKFHFLPGFEDPGAGTTQNNSG